MGLGGKIWKAVQREVGAYLLQNAGPAEAQTVTSHHGPPEQPLVMLYSEAIALLRDQINAQLESASTNDLESMAALAAGLALVVTLVLLRATDPTHLGWWWWYPLPGFAVAAGFLYFPLRSPNEKRKFEHGPKIPVFMRNLGAQSLTLEVALQGLMKDLQKCFNNNDAILAKEARSLTWGLRVLAIVTIASVGLYAWGLN